jgi:hypothetical protein
VLRSFRFRAFGRKELVDRFLDRAEAWNKVAEACLNHAGQQQHDSSHSKLLMEQLRQCSDHATLPERQQIVAFVAAVQGRWFWRQMPWLNGAAQQHSDK